MSWQVEQPGLCSLLVAAGRPHARHLGLPWGGAADRYLWQLGNLLVGNAPDALALEVAQVGPTLRALVDVGAVVVGAGFRVQCAGQTVPVGQTFTVRAGQTLTIGPGGWRGYLCVVGGLVAPTVLGCSSAFVPLAVGDTLTCAASSVVGRSLAAEAWPGASSAPLRILPGAQMEWFAPQLAEWSAGTFVVQSASDRMGVRLRGVALTRPPGELLSEPVLPGTVQVTHDGQCIVLGIDGQTIGGYPKMAQVIRADWDRLARLTPGTMVRWAWVDLGTAQQAWCHEQAHLTEWQTRLSVNRAGR